MDVYDNAFALMKSGKESDGLEVLKKHAEANPQQAKAWFEYAGGFDFLGREAEALPHYQRARELGNLSIDDQPRLLVQMGSTLRNLKRYDEAKTLLREAITLHPQVGALKAFLGLAEYSDGAYRKSAKLFLEASLAKDPSIQDYSRALQSYLDTIDTFPARQRQWMRVLTTNAPDPGTATRVAGSHVPSLAELMDLAYQGTVDHEGETREQCVAEMQGTLDGKYGPLLNEASFVSLDGHRVTSASLVTLWKGRPLLAWSMTRPDSQGRGLAGHLLRKSIHATGLAGYPELYLVVTEGNVPAEKLYLKLGFERLGPALPAKGV